jgi:hypothetical protein
MKDQEIILWIKAKILFLMQINAMSEHECYEYFRHDRKTLMSKQLDVLKKTICSVTDFSWNRKL